MKHYFLIISLFLLSFPSFAQKIVDSEWSTLAFLANESRIGLDIDFSEATILNMEVEIFIEQEDDWDEGLADIKKRFIQAFNEKSSIPISNNSPHEYTILIKPSKVWEKGSHVKGVFYIVDQEGGFRFVRSFDTENGIIGSTLNLMGDAFEEFGESLGKQFKKNIKKK